MDADICCYFNHKAYGIEVPGGGDYPSLCPANTLAYHKKALPANMAWDDVSLRENPTKSSAVNKLILSMKNHLDDFKNEICSMLLEHKRFMVCMNQNICHIAI
jgi:hypothetical protein